MTIKSHGGIFGRNPTFNNVTVDGTLTVDQIVEKTSAGGITLDGVTLKDGNVVLADGKGIDFSATSGTGTSELFDDYEEGTWTPTDNSGAGLTLSASGFYTKIGRQVTLTFSITYPVNSAASAAVIGNLPFAVGDGNLQSGGYTTFKTYTSDIRLFSAGTNLEIYNGSASQVLNSALSAHNIRGVVTYFV